MRTRAAPFLTVWVSIVAALVVASPAEATFPGKNGLIAFDRTTDTSVIHTMEPDGTGLAQLAEGFEPAWSPNGRRIAYARWMERDGQVEIYSMRADGTGQRRLTRSPAQETEPSFSPDGRRILFMRDAGTPGVGDEAIHVMRADGSDPRRLTHDHAFNAYPKWSPRGNRIVFVSDRGPGSNSDLFTMRPDGSRLKPLTRTRRTDESQPDWSPSGKRIAFSAWRPRDRGGIFTVRARGGGVTRITGEPGDGTPAWSPNGRWIAFDRFDDDGRTDIFRARPSGRGLLQLTSGDELDVHPAWQPR